MLLDLALLGIVLYFIINEQKNNSDTLISNGFPPNIYRNNEQKLSQVNPILANKVRQIINTAFLQGYILYVDEGLRSQATQDKYYAQGRTTAGNIITYARTSKHTQGKAIDLMPVVNGKPTNNLSLFNWQLIGQWANQFGLTWGGNWTNLKDYRHLEI